MYRHCNNKQEQMGRSSLPTNPFRWKKKLLRKGSDQSTTIDDDQTRKTVLSSNNSLHDFSRSCDIEDLPNNFAANASWTTATAIPTQIQEHHKSYSEPSFPSYDMNNFNNVPLPRSYEQQQEQMPLHHHIAVGMPISISPQQWYMPCSTSQRPQVSAVPPRSPQQQSSSSKPNTTDPALEARLDAIKIQEQLLGENHPDVIFALSSLAKLYQKRGYHVDAASLLKETKMRSSRSHSAPQLYPQEKANVPTEIEFSHPS